MNINKTSIKSILHKENINKTLTTRKKPNNPKFNPIRNKSSISFSQQKMTIFGKLKPAVRFK